MILTIDAIYKMVQDLYSNQALFWVTLEIFHSVTAM